MNGFSSFSTKKKGLTQMQTVALGYLAVIIAGTVLLSLPFSSRDGSPVGLIDAFMTATSSACVTGLIPVPTYQSWSAFGQAVLLLLIQVGGIGIMTVVALLTRAAGKRISLNKRKLLMLSTGNDSLNEVSSLIKSVTLSTLAFEFAGAAALSVRFIPEYGVGFGIWSSVFHSVSAFCNAGFDLMGKFGQSSLTGFTSDILVNSVIMLLIIAGGLGFSVWQELITFRPKQKPLSLHAKIVLFMNAVMFLGGAVLFFIFELKNPDMSVKERILSALFDSVTPRTAGFNTVDIPSLSQGSIALMILLMVIGGAPGSTAGGIKITTFLVLLVGTVASARQNDSAVVFKRSITRDLIHQASAIATVYFGIAAFSVVAICAVEPFGFTEVTFEVISALSNVGMTMGITGSLTVFSKLLISVLMYFGRVGMMSLVIALTAKREYIPASRPTENVYL